MQGSLLPVIAPGLPAGPLGLLTLADTTSPGGKNNPQTPAPTLSESAQQPTANIQQQPIGPHKFPIANNTSTTNKNHLHPRATTTSGQHDQYPTSTYKHSKTDSNRIHQQPKTGINTSQQCPTIGSTWKCWEGHVQPTGAPSVGCSPWTELGGRVTKAFSKGFSTPSCGRYLLPWLSSGRSLRQEVHTVEGAQHRCARFRDSLQRV